MFEEGLRIGWRGDVDGRRLHQRHWQANITLYECVCICSPCAQMGATIDLVLNQPFTLIKDNWDFITLDRLGV